MSQSPCPQCEYVNPEQSYFCNKCGCKLKKTRALRVNPDTLLTTTPSTQKIENTQNTDENNAVEETGSGTASTIFTIISIIIAALPIIIPIISAISKKPVSLAGLWAIGICSGITMIYISSFTVGFVEGITSTKAQEFTVKMVVTLIFIIVNFVLVNALDANYVLIFRCISVWLLLFNGYHIITSGSQKHSATIPIFELTFTASLLIEEIFGL